jgi:hypothetical protein
MREIPLHLQRRFEQRWAARFPRLEIRESEIGRHAKRHRGHAAESAFKAAG